jgi:membrane peptidoglycan carboxypeptidase
MSRSIKRVSNVCISALVKNGDMTQAQADRVKAQKAQVTKRPTTKRTTTKKRPVRTTSRKKR